MSWIIDTDVVTKALLEGFAGNDYLAIRYRSFVPRDQALKIAGNVIKHPSLSTYRNTEELLRVGESHYETHDPGGEANQAALDEYLDHADLLMNQIRSCCLPYESPLDRLWKMLDREMRAERVSINGRPMFAGIVRVFPDGSELLPHNDIFRRDAPYLEVAKEISAQFAANIYLQVPHEGGEIRLWKERFTDEELRQMAREGSEYGCDPEKLPPPSLELKPEPGELLIIDSTRLHAVKASHGGTRVGMSCFLGYRPGKPLVYWS